MTPKGQRQMIDMGKEGRMQTRCRAPFHSNNDIVITRSHNVWLDVFNHCLNFFLQLMYCLGIVLIYSLDLTPL